MINKENNYAFIDSQNLNLGIKEQGWILDFKRFRVYLREKYGITKDHVELWGAGSPYREFLFVEDLAQAALFLMQTTDKNQINTSRGNTK